MDTIPLGLFLAPPRYPTLIPNTPATSFFGPMELLGNIANPTITNSNPTSGHLKMQILIRPLDTHKKF